MTEYHNEWYHKNKERLKAGRQDRHRVEYRKRKEFIRQHKLDVGACSICSLQCNMDNHVAFDWDHIDPSQKKFSLGDTRSQPLEVVRAEISKCRLLCKNCHAIETHKAKHWAIGREGRQYDDTQLSLMEML